MTIHLVQQPRFARHNGGWCVLVPPGYAYGCDQRLVVATARGHTVTFSAPAALRMPDILPGGWQRIPCTMLGGGTHTGAGDFDDWDALRDFGYDNPGDW